MNHQNHTQQRDGNRKALGAIVGLLLAWSFLIALGAMLRDEPFDFRKPLIVVGTMGAFLGIWLGAIVIRGSQLKKNDRSG